MTLLRSCARVNRCAGVIAACAVTALAQLAVSPSASATDSPSSTEAQQECREDDGTSRYLVLFEEGTSRKRAKSEVVDACGKQTAYYPEIAVGVAVSKDPDFAKSLGAGRAFSAQRERRILRTRLAGSAQERLRPQVTVADPGQVSSHDRSDEQWNLRMINADLASGERARTKGVVVGVLDSGIDASHPDLAGSIEKDLSAGCLDGEADTGEKSWTATTSAHGTHVAGTIAAADDGAGITGVAPGVRLASIKVIGDSGHVDPEAVVCGLMWAAEHNMKITNSSYFVNPSALSCSGRDGLSVARAAIGRASEHATEQGTLNIAAATNEAASLSPAGSAENEGSGGCEALPASLRSVVAVSSVGPSRVKARYSSYGLGVIDVAAPGGDDDQCVLSTVPGGYDELCGTSMAAPHVAGVAALAAGAKPDAGPEELRRTLTRGARPMDCPVDYDLAGDGKQDAYCTGYRGYNSFYGHGMTDAISAVRSTLTGGR